jgi:hypothetical protein
LHTRRLIAQGLALLLVQACGGGGGGSPSPPPPPPRDFSFAEGRDSWEAQYADYAPGQETGIAFASSHGPLPQPLAHLNGYRLFSNNQSDDVFMYVYGRIEGLSPNQAYRLSFTVRFATNAPPGCPGIGGAPGESVYVKAGATTREPGNVVENGKVITNFDKGDQSGAGARSLVLGNIARSSGACDTTLPFELKTLSSDSATLRAQADEGGRLWIFLGTDSGFEGPTEIFYLGGSVVLAPA